MAITQFEQTAIDTAAKHHSDMVTELQGRLNKLRGDVDSTLGVSPNEATRALQATYDSWIQDVEKMIVTRVQSLSGAMTATAQSQMDMDEQNSKNITEVAQFIYG